MYWLLNMYNKIQTALVIEGGAMRGIFSAGILDEFIAQQFYPFDLHIGVSAGASNMVSYLAEEYQRSYHVYTDYCRRKEFKNMTRFMFGGHLIDLDWLWEISERERPINFEIMAQKKPLLITVTNAQTGNAEYLSPEPENVSAALKASSCMPLAYKHPISLYKKQWFDGGVAESLPVQEAYQRGAKRIMLLRSNPKNYIKKPYKIAKLLPFLLKSYPQIAQRLQQRHRDYNQTIQFIRQPPKDCQIIEVCPPDTFSAGQFTVDLNILDDAYQMGERIGKQLIKSW